MPKISLRKVVLVLLVAQFAACGFFGDESNKRAQEFVKTLVLDSGNNSRLKDLSEGPLAQQPQDLLDNLSVKATINYLRTKRRVGAGLQFSALRTQKDNEFQERVVVTVLVTEAGITKNVRFNVDMRKLPTLGWRVSAVRVAN